MAYDTKCWELAEAFLSDEPPFTKDEAIDLAKIIQDTIEDWFANRRVPVPPGEPMTDPFQGQLS